MLTKAEALVAAERADVYPKGYGYRYGYNGVTLSELIRGERDMSYG